MKTNRAFYLGLVLLLLAVDFSSLNWKVNVMVKANSEDPKTNEKKGSTEQTSVSNSNSNSVSDSNTAEKEKKNRETQVTKSKENTENADGKHDNGSKKSNDEDQNGQSGSRKTGNVEKDNGKLKDKSQSDDKEKKKIVPKAKGKEGDSEVPVKDSHVEDCDSSNKCTDDENKFFACLRVPGNDLQYSLLIQNKAKKPLVVVISAPDFVKLEKTEIQLQPEANQKVEVSITKGGSENLIVLKAGNGHCNLDIKHLIAENSDNLIDSEKSTYFNFMSRTHVIIVISFAALLVLAAGWAFVSFRKKQLSAAASGAKYRRLDADLPVSGGVKAEPENNEGWDNSWGDDWDDEEAPKTPSMPLTPSLSSKGLASRRLTKEAWKD